MAVTGVGAQPFWASLTVLGGGFPHQHASGHPASEPAGIPPDWLAAPWLGPWIRIKRQSKLSFLEKFPLSCCHLCLGHGRSCHPPGDVAAGAMV